MKKSTVYFGIATVVMVLLAIYFTNEFKAKNLSEVKNLGKYNISKIVITDSRNKNWLTTIDDKDKIDEFISKYNTEIVKKEFIHKSNNGWNNEINFFQNDKLVSCLRITDDLELDGSYYKVVKGDITQASLLNIVFGSKGSVEIIVDRKAYSPIMSSIRGITLTPKLTTKELYEDVTYHWHTEYGSFIKEGKSDVTNEGYSVLWSTIDGDKVVNATHTFDITLEVVGVESKAIIATDKITIVPNDGLYEVVGD